MAVEPFHYADLRPLQEALFIRDADAVVMRLSDLVEKYDLTVSDAAIARLTEAARKARASISNLPH